MSAEMHDFNDGCGPVPAHQHANGGGWVADTAHVDASAQVSGDTLVYGDARVYGNARVYGAARVYGDALVFGGAQVSGDALVYGDARVYGNALVYGNARVYGAARVYGNARVYGDARVYRDARVFGNALVYGNAWVIKHSRDLLQIGPIGSENRTITIWLTAPEQPRIIAGCFEGTLEAFEQAVAKTHGENVYGREYVATVAYLKVLVEARKAEAVAS